MKTIITDKAGLAIAIFHLAEDILPRDWILLHEVCNAYLSFPAFVV